MWRVTLGDYRASRLDSVLYAPVAGFPKPVSQSFSWGWDGNSGVYDCELASDHPAFMASSLCSPYVWCEVYNTAVSRDYPIWRGYHVETPDSFGAGSTGSVGMSFAGELGQLSQVTAPRYDTTFEQTGLGTPEEQLVALVLAQYNRYTEEGRRILAGRVDTWHLGSLSLSDDGTSSTCYDVLKRHFVDDMGGYMYLSYDADGAKLNCVSKIEDRSTQQVRFGVNELGFDRTESALELSSGVKPMGAKLSETAYAGKYFVGFAPIESLPSDWADSFSGYYTASAFEPLTSEPDGWGLSAQDAEEGGMKRWDDYWFYDEKADPPMWAKLGEGSRIESRPEFLAEGSDGRVCYWDAKADDPLAATSLEGFTEKVKGIGYTRLDQEPANFPEGCYRPSVEAVKVPYQAAAGDGVTWVPAMVLAWRPAATRYERVTSRPAQWLWDSGDNYSKYYRVDEQVADPVHGGTVDSYKAISKKHRRVYSEPSDWGEEWTQYKLKSGDSFKSVPSYTKAGLNRVGFQRWNWPHCYEDYYEHSFDGRTGVERFEKYKCVWRPVLEDNVAYCPDHNGGRGGYVGINRDTWGVVRHNLWAGTSDEDGQPKGKSSCASKEWKDGMVDRGWLKGSTSEKLWYKEPPSHVGPDDGWPAECYVPDAPRWGVLEVWEEYVPEFGEQAVYRAVEPDFEGDKARGIRYYVKRPENVAPGSDDDPRSEADEVWPEAAPFAFEPVYASTGQADDPLEMGLVEDEGEQLAFLDAASRESKLSGFSWDGDVLWHDGAVASYGKRSAALKVDDATDYVALLAFAMEKLDKMRVPSLEVQMKAVDLSPAGDADPLVPGKLVPVVDAPHGMGRADAPVDMPCVAVSQIDFADPQSGSIELGAALGSILGGAGATVAVRQGGGTGYALSNKAYQLFREGTGVDG